MLRLGLPKLWVVLGWEVCEGRHKIGLGIGLESGWWLGGGITLHFGFWGLDLTRKKSNAIGV
nr:MAG TPA: hypothetical protein [Caudoviricetes sp.]